MGQFQLGKKMTSFLWAITLGVVSVNLYTISNAVFGEGMVSHLSPTEPIFKHFYHTFQRMIVC
jgi:hypothetical protein